MIDKTALACDRASENIRLLAVSKTRTDKDIAAAYAAGICDFGENYLQEALPKLQALSTLPLCWHFIGPIQSNKTEGIAKNFSWVHSVSRQKIAQLLNDARPVSLPRLNICIQVNLDEEATKTGVNENSVAALAAFILQLPRLHLRGLMLLPKQQSDERLQYASFLRLAALRDHLNQTLDLSMDTLSMGMSHDFPAAIRAGSTIVRVGSAIFGTRS